MLPARYPGFSPAMHGGPAIRTIVTVAVAALIGTVVGGLSVLGVVVAVVQPSNQELRTDAGRDAGAAAVVPGGAAVPGQLPSPASSQVPSQGHPRCPAKSRRNVRQIRPPARRPLSARWPHRSRPPRRPRCRQCRHSQPPRCLCNPPKTRNRRKRKAQPPQPQATQGPQITWPDALTRRTAQERAPENPAPTPNPQASPGQSAAAPAKEPASEQGAVDRALDRTAIGSPGRPQGCRQSAAASQPTMPWRRGRRRRIRVSPYDMPAGKTPSSRRVVTTPPIESPAPPDVGAAAAAPPDAPRSLFDFFGGGQFRDDRDAGGPPDASRQQALPEPPLRDTRGGARRVVRQQRHDEPAELEQRAPEPASDHWGGFFGGWHRDNWNDDN